MLPLWVLAATLGSLSATLVAHPRGLTFQTHVSPPETGVPREIPVNSFTELEVQIRVPRSEYDPEMPVDEVTIHADWVATDPFFQEAADPSTGPVRALPGVFCEGVPNVTVPAPFFGAEPRGDADEEDEPPGERVVVRDQIYGPIGVSPRGYCEAYCEAQTYNEPTPRCVGPLTTAAMSAMCECVGTRVTTEAVTNPVEVLLTASLDRTGAARTRWSGRSQLPFRVLGSDVRGLTVAFWGPAEWAGEWVYYVVAGKDSLGKAIQWRREVVIVRRPPPPCRSRENFFNGLLSKLSTSTWFFVGLFRDVLGMIIGRVLISRAAAVWKMRRTKKAKNVARLKVLAKELIALTEAPVLAEVQVDPTPLAQ